MDLTITYQRIEHFEEFKDEGKVIYTLSYYIIS